MLNMDADSQAYYGRLQKARDVARRAADSAVRADAKETGAQWIAFQAVREAELGNASAARQAVARALALAPGRNVKVLAALALARTGETTQSKSLLETLQKSDPTNTFLKVYWFPVLEASIAMAQQAPDRATVALEPSLPYELGEPPPGISTMYPAYIRGLAYLAQKNGPAGAAEFQKFVDHPGVVRNFLLGSLARLQLGRAYSMAGDSGKAKAAYQQFFSIWKDADPDVPILKEAKAEYAKLQ
jgi:tetratricopeptide (TPR) repeat protein